MIDADQPSGKDIGETPLLAIDQVSKHFGALAALDKVSLSVKPGEIFALLGMNGAGKTTLIECICGLQNTFQGSIQVAGFDVVEEYRRARQLVGLVPQELNFDGFFQTAETVIAQGGYFGVRNARQRAMELLKRFGLHEKRDDNTRKLSGGMKRRLMICKALMHQPPLLFLDEPTAGVDVELREDLWNYVRELRDRGTTLFLTTHYLEEAEQLADRIGIINHGRLLLTDQRDRLMKRFGRQWISLQLAEPPSAKLLESLRTYEIASRGSEIRIHRPPSSPEATDAASLQPILDLIREHSGEIRRIESGQSRLEDIFRDLLQKDTPEGKPTTDSPTTVSP